MLGENLVSNEAIQTSDFSGELYRPLGPQPHAGVLVLHGSDPTSEFPNDYARLLAAHGYAALCLTYVGTPDTPDTLTEVPLCQFTSAIHWLLQSDWVDTDRIGILAWSRGTEAAFLTADRNDQIGAVIGYSPSAYVFPAYPPSKPTKSAWLDNGEPVPFVPPYQGIEDDENKPGVVRFRKTIEHSPEEQLRQASLPVRNIDGPVFLVSGSEDRIWPSREFSNELTERIDSSNHQAIVRSLTYENAGHAITTPYTTMTEDILSSMGGNKEGTAYAAIDAWERTLSILNEGLY